MKKYIITFFILIVTFITASETKIPSATILNNPHKEVSTVEGLTTRDTTKVNIKVKKRTLEEIEGVESSEGVDFILPEKDSLVNEEIKVVKSLANLSMETSKNKQRRSMSSIEVPSTIIDLGDKKIVKIAKAAEKWLEEDKAEVISTVLRAQNLVKEEYSKVEEKLFADDSEKVLYENYLKIKADFEKEISQKNYTSALEIYENICPHINNLFDSVMIMDKDELVKINRLGLLNLVVSVVAELMDISKLNYK